MELMVSQFVTVFVILLISTAAPCLADINLNTGFQCTNADNSTSQITFQTNLKNLFDALVSNAPLHSGFYSATIGQQSSQIYGLIQCRGDVSANDCAVCTRNATAFALSECPGNQQGLVWFTWCYLRYSDQNFFGVMDQTAIAVANDSNYDDPSVISLGLDLMSGLAYNASQQPLMFETGVLDAGQNGKRYGMAQCTRDISRHDCQQCLAAQLTNFKTAVGTKKDWEIYGFNCFLWYHSYQFYFNVSQTTNEGGEMFSPHRDAAISLTMTFLSFLAVL